MVLKCSDPQPVSAAGQSTWLVGVTAGHAQRNGLCSWKPDPRVAVLNVAPCISSARFVFRCQSCVLVMNGLQSS